MQMTKAQKDFKFWQVLLRSVLATKQRRRNRPTATLRRTYHVPEADLNQ